MHDDNDDSDLIDEDPPEDFSDYDLRAQVDGFIFHAIREGRRALVEERGDKATCCGALVTNLLSVRKDAA